MFEGKKEAIRFAQTELRPKFFEEVIKEEFKRELEQTPAAAPVMAKMNTELAMMAEISSDLAPISAVEFRAATDIKTILDKEASTLAFQVSELRKKVMTLSGADASYQGTSSIPYGSVSCGKVYKGVAALKKVCEASYASLFAEQYNDSRYNTYESEYPSLFEKLYTPLLSAKRSQTFEATFAAYQKTAKEEGVVQGKVVAFNQSFEQNRSETYDKELPGATEIARTNAEDDAVAWISTHPMITASSVKSDLTKIKGGDKGSILINFKNISPVALKDNIMIQIKETQLVTVNSKVATLSNIKGQSQILHKDIKFTVLDSARSGQKIVIKGDLLLPGDKYQSQRKESFTIEKSLAANPAAVMTLDYDSTPKIKNIFKYFSQKFKIQIAPKFEKLDLGYKIELKPTGEFAKLVKMPTSIISTSALNANQIKEFVFTYKFHKDARKQPIPFILNIIHDGELVETRKIELKPHRSIL